MKETDVQSKIIKAVEEAGGVAQKLANKYQRGVSDLLIKLIGFEPMLAEVKFDQIPVRLKWVKLNVTPLQSEFLTRFDRAGMASCIISVLHDPPVNYHIKNYYIGIFSPTLLSAPVEDYSTPIPSAQFNQSVVYHLERWLMSMCK